MAENLYKMLMVNSYHTGLTRVIDCLRERLLLGCTWCAVVAEIGNKRISVN